VRYRPGNHYWLVGNDDSRVYSSQSARYVASDDRDYVAWQAEGGRPTRIGDEVLLQDVLLKGAPRAAFTRDFTAAEVLATLAMVDRSVTTRAFADSELASPTAELAPRIAALADDLQMKIGKIGA
jgi:hypothetical protein